MSIPAPVLAQEEELKPDLTIAGIKPYHYYDEEDETFKGEPWFNLENYVVVTVENKDDAGDAEVFNVSLWIDDELFGKQELSSLEAGGLEKVYFDWTPVGEDCFDDDCSFTDTSREYEFKAVVDCKNESDTTNNEETVVEKVCYNGYMADEPLKNIAQGTVHGGLIFTTGDGEYWGLYSAGASKDTTYGITLPEGASVVLARLNVYYTWHKDKESCPKMEVSIDGTTVSLDASYNDIKCWGSNNYLWGNYVYDLTDNIQGSGTYTVTVERTGASMFSIAAPGIILVYEDKNAPMREYWINEGADLLIGGRRDDAGYLSLDECKNTAKFLEPEEPVDLEVEKAALGVVSPWAELEPPEGRHNYVYFNGVEIGQDVYCGYHGSCSSDGEIESISMSVESEVAEVGIAAFDVTDYLEGYDNEVIQGDDGDNMMPTNAFLVITYEEEEGEEEQIPPDIIPQEPVDTEINNIEGESRTFSVSIDQTVDIVWQLNGTEVQTDEDVTEASYTNASAVLGTWNVSAIGTSRETGLSGMHTWIWNVTAAVGTTPTSAVNITSTPSPTPTLTATPASSVSATPTPIPTPTTAIPRPEEKKKAGAEETKAPGFELAMSSFILIAVAYLLRKRRKL
jgi:cell division septation protein DedD